MADGPIKASTNSLTSVPTLPQPGTATASGLSVSNVPQNHTEGRPLAPTVAPKPPAVNDHYTGIPGDGVVPG